MVRVKFQRMDLDSEEAGLKPNPTRPPPQWKCGGCNNPFEFPKESLAKCPICGQVTSLGSSYARSRGIIYSIMAIVFLIIIGGMIYFTHELALEQEGTLFIVVYCMGFLIALLFIARAIYYFTRKVSSIVINYADFMEDL